MAGIVESICVSERKGTVKVATPRARLVQNHGVDGDAHAGPGHRQVSILGLAEIESFKRTAGLRLRAGAFAENLILSGDDLGSLGLGSHIRVGDTAVLRITQLGKQCHHRCAIFHQTGDCIMPRVGLFARVVEGGDIEVGARTQVLSVVDRCKLQVVVLTDTAETTVASLVRDSLAAHVYSTEMLPAGPTGLADRLRHYADGHSIDLIVVVGGAGAAFDEVIRDGALVSAPLVLPSRTRSGVRGSTLILALPGPDGAATESLRALLPALPQCLAKLRRAPEESGRPSIREP